MEFDDLASLDSAEVQSEDGLVIGEIAAVHLDEGSAQVRFVEVASETPRENFIVPVANATISQDTVVVPYTADNIKHGPVVDPNETLSVGEIGAVIGYYGAGQVDLTGHAIGERSTVEADTQEAGDPFRKKNLPPVVYYAEQDGEVEYG